MDRSVVPRRHRRFVFSFLAVLVVTSAAGVEAWPFTGWGLYSRRLTAVSTDLKAATVDGGGREHSIPWGHLPLGYRNTYRQLPDVIAAPPDEREPVCRAWAKAVTDLGGQVEGIRVYETTTLRRFDGSRQVERRQLLLTCAEARPAK